MLKTNETHTSVTSGKFRPPVCRADDNESVEDDYGEESSP